MQGVRFPNRDEPGDVFEGQVIQRMEREDGTYYPCQPDVATRPTYDMWRPRQR